MMFKELFVRNKINFSAIISQKIFRVFFIVYEHARMSCSFNSQLSIFNCVIKFMYPQVKNFN